jgi:hypothetical protein
MSASGAKRASQRAQLMSAFGVKRTTTNREKIPHNCSSYRDENQTAARHGEATTELTAVEPRRAALIDQLDLQLVFNRDGHPPKNLFGFAACVI